MTDTLTPSERSERMSRIRGQDTGPERLVRSVVHSMGFRYRLHRKDLPGKPDLAFGPQRKVIFVHGCFWHRHDDPDCKLARLPKSKQEFWSPKLEGNKQRDKNNENKITDMGWKFLIVWECETRDKEKMKKKIKEFLGDK